MSGTPSQVWEQVVDGRAHLVEAHGSARHRVVWRVDGEVVAEASSWDEKVELRPERPEGADGSDGSDGSEGSDGDLGVLGVRFGLTGRGRRATLAPDSAALATGRGATDLLPEPGSPAAVHEERVREHPGRYTALETAGGVAKVIVPIVVVALLARLAFTVPLPDWDLPSIPLPALPDLPLPSLPSIPWPDWDLPDWELPGWLAWLLDHAQYVVPVVVAFVLARAEVRRRRTQDEKREQDDPEEG